MSYDFSENKEGKIVL